MDLVEALDATFRSAAGYLDRWTPDILDEEIRRQFETEEWVYTRGSVIQRVIPTPSSAWIHDLLWSAYALPAYFRVSDGDVGRRC